jgi:hypothetical protein
MAGRLAQMLDRWHLRKVQARWSTAAEAAGEMEPATLRSLRSEARGMRRQIDRLVHAVDERLALSLAGVSQPHLPVGTDWRWRPDLWRGRLPQAWALAAGPRTDLRDDLSLHHDCPLGEIMARQMPSGDPADRAAFGLAIETYAFQGSFLSLDLPLPQAMVEGLQHRHLVQVDAVIDSDRPLRAFARLNLQHGAEVAQLLSDLPGEGREKTVEFDLAYAKLEGRRIERVWLDLIFNDVAMAQILLRDLLVSRRPRAEL